jgi:squalene-hopene/tetraprenyl-beta-curcumene cyclase
MNFHLAENATQIAPGAHATVLVDHAGWHLSGRLNYIKGTWSALCALDMAGVDRNASEMARAADWVAAIQNEDGGWGEDGASYKLDYRGHEPAPSAASQSAWALLGLTAAGRTRDPSVARGVKFLLDAQGAHGFWDEERRTATGFPRVFYLRYHGYSEFGRLPDTKPDIRSDYQI